MLSPKAKKVVRKSIREHFGHCNLAEVRKTLKNEAVSQYGGYINNVEIGNGIELYYTDNPNHFCEYGIKLGGIGYTRTLAITKKDLTKAGRIRIGDYIESHYAM